MLLTHLEVNFEDKIYDMGDAPTFEQGEWQHDKATLPIPFPNLPYYIDGDFYLSESWAILKYICWKHRLEYNGRNLKEEAHVGMLQGVLTELRTNVARANYSPEFAVMKPAAIESSVGFLNKFATYLQGKRFLVGDEPTYVDFFFFELLQYIEAWEPGLIARVSEVFALYQTNFRSLPHISEFELRPRLPFNTKTGFCLTT
jgi:glutathione S-transferase